MTEQSTNDTSEDLRLWRRRILFTALSVQIALPIQQNNAAHADPAKAAQTDLVKNTSAAAASADERNKDRGGRNDRRDNRDNRGDRRTDRGNGRGGSNGNADRERRAEEDRRRRENTDRERRAEEDRRRRENTDRERRAEEDRRRRENTDRERRAEEDRRRRENTDRERRAEEDRRRRENTDRERRRQTENDRRRREREEDRRADRREQDRRRADRIDHERRSRNNRLAEREERRRRQSLEERREHERRLSERRRYRHDARNDFSRYRRRVHRDRYHDHRDHTYWRYRYDRWYHHVHRPIFPVYPIVIIEVPVRFPDYGDYWDRHEIVELADAIEILALNIYRYTESHELNAPSPWNDQALSLLYDVVRAAQIYSDAVDASPYLYRDTLYELFNLEEALHLASSHILCGPLTPRVRDSFALMKYYVAELLWQYRLDPLYERSTNVMTTAHAASLSSLQVTEVGRLQPNAADTLWSYSDMDDSTMACESFSFRWTKPHNQEEWRVGDTNPNLVADKLVIGTMGTSGLKGRSGVAGITRLLVYYNDGYAEDLIRKAYDLRDPHVHHNGQLRLITEDDRIELPLIPNVPIEGIFIEADSWISPDQNVALSLSLARGEMRLP